MPIKPGRALILFLSAGSVLTATTNGVAQCSEDKLVAGDAAEEAEFGRSVAIQGDLVAVGATQDDEFGHDAGAVYMFRFDPIGLAWVEEAKLVPKDVSVYDRIGGALLSDDEVFIGCAGDDDNGTDSGSVYVFRFNPRQATWVEEQKILPADGMSEDIFGSGIAISDGVLVVAARGDDNANGNAAGAVYVFEWGGTEWVEKQKLLADDGVTSDRFGSAVSIDGDTIVVGAKDDENFGDDTGAAYVFDYDNRADQWVQVQKLIPSDARHNTDAGESVAICGDWLAVGAAGDDENGHGSGAVYMFNFDPNTSLWEEKQKILPEDGEENDWFGEGLSLSGGTLAIGRYSDHNENGFGAGAVHVYLFNGAKWRETIKLIASDGEQSDYLGRAVCTDGQRVIAGAYEDDDGGPRSGAAYVFDVPRLGDLDADCVVGAHDLILLLGVWGECPNMCNNCQVDLDGDCTIGPGDLIILLGNWG